MEKIKNDEELSHTLPVSIKCRWRKNGIVNVIQDIHNAYLGVENLYQEIEDRSRVK